MASSKQRAEKSQSDKFTEAAREHGCDEDEAAFDEKLRRIARQKPKPPDKAKGGDDSKS